MPKTIRDIIHYWQGLPDEAINQLYTYGDEVCHAEHAARLIFGKNVENGAAYSDWNAIYSLPDFSSLLRDHGAPSNPFSGWSWGNRQEVYKRVLENGDPEILDRPIPGS